MGRVGSAVHVTRLRSRVSRKTSSECGRAGATARTRANEVGAQGQSPGSGMDRGVPVLSRSSALTARVVRSRGRRARSYGRVRVGAGQSSAIPCPPAPSTSMALCAAGGHSSLESTRAGVECRMSGVGYRAQRVNGAVRGRHAKRVRRCPRALDETTPVLFRPCASTATGGWDRTVDDGADGADDTGR